MLGGKRIVIATMSLTLLTVAACKNSSTNNILNPATCTVTPSGCYNQSNIGFSGGAAVTLNIANTTVLSQYAGAWVQPTSAVTLNINTHPVNANFLGEANIQYFVGNVNHNGHFTNGSSTDHGNNVHMNYNGTYRLFFEDPAGVIIITMSGTVPGTDTSFGSLNGTVYFRNFNAAGPNPLYQSYVDPLTGAYFQSQPYNFCWSGLITMGPYDCRNMSIPPDQGGSYAVTVLGTFTGLDLHSALGI